MTLMEGVLAGGLVPGGGAWRGVIKGPFHDTQPVRLQGPVRGALWALVGRALRRIPSLTGFLALTQVDGGLLWVDAR
jgi:hypothetical protein